MPNYCDNYLRIDGPADAVKNLIDFVKSNENKFDFNKIVPMGRFQQGHDSIHLHIVKALNDVKILHRRAPDCGKVWLLRERTLLNPPAASS